MSATRPESANARTGLTLLAAAGACALLGGCIGNPLTDAKVDPSSPVAADVARLARANTDYPSFREIPAVPTDLRPIGLYGREAREVKLAGEALIRATAPETWSLQNTDAFVAKAQRDAGPALEPSNPSNAEAFARELRERATPPPPR